MIVRRHNTTLLKLDHQEFEMSCEQFKVDLQNIKETCDIHLKTVTIRKM